MKLPYLAVFAALFVSPGDHDKPVAPPVAPTNDVVVAAQPEVVPVEAIVDEVQTPSEPAFVAPELPKDMKVVVNGKAGVKTLTLVHQGHLVSLRRSDTVVLGENSVSAPMKDITSMTWESSDRKTFATLRGVVEWQTLSGTRETPKLRATAQITPSREISARRHECRAFEDTTDVMTVICRVDSLAVGAARAFGSQPREGIAMAEVGEHRYFRTEVDVRENDFDAVVIGYSDGAVGHVIRVEASKLSGETKASFSLLEATRAQPIPVRRFFEHHHPPHDFDFFL